MISSSFRTEHTWKGLDVANMRSPLIEGIDKTNYWIKSIEVLEPDLLLLTHQSNSGAVIEIIWDGRLGSKNSSKWNSNELIISAQSAWTSFKAHVQKEA